MQQAVVVTGGRGGVGRGIVRRLVGDGWHVVVIDPVAAAEGSDVEVVVGNAADLAVAAEVNVSSHQAQRAVTGALPYATAKVAWRV